MSFDLKFKMISAIHNEKLSKSYPTGNKIRFWE